MARILVTGSSDGLGLRAAQRLVQRGHTVVLHARNAERAKDATSACPGAETVVIGDLSKLKETKDLAEQVNKLGRFDCVIHNAGLFRGGFRKTEDGIPALVAVNTIAPYVLANLINRPSRLVFLSSSMHRSGSGSLEDVLWKQRGEAKWSDNSAYCDSKLHNVLFAKAFAKQWPDVTVTSMDPGWIATKMGGAGASEDPEKAVETYILLGEGTEDKAKKSGSYWRPGANEATPKDITEDSTMQKKLLKICEECSGVPMS